VLPAGSVTQITQFGRSNSQADDQVGRPEQDIVCFAAAWL